MIVKVVIFILIAAASALSRRARIQLRESGFVRAEPDLWAGETVKLAGPAYLTLLTKSSRVMKGWLYLTDFRLIWTPSISTRGFDLGDEPVDVRLTQIKTPHKLPWSPFRNGFGFTAFGEQFVLHTSAPFDEMGSEAKGPREWLAALGAID